MTADNKDFTFEAVPSEETPIVETAAAVPKLTSDLDDNDESPSDPSDNGVLAGCFLAGCILGGPCLALLTTLGGNWAKNKEGPFGESTRAIGRVADAAVKTAKGT